MSKNEKPEELIFILPGNYGKNCKGNGSCFDNEGYLINCLCGDCRYFECCNDPTYRQCCADCTESCPRYLFNEVTQRLKGGAQQGLLRNL